MEIKAIFGAKHSKECKIWNVHYKDQACQEIHRLLQEWSDVAYLRDFFKQRQQLLINKWNGLSVNKAIAKCMTENDRFYSNLETAEERAQQGDFALMEQLFCLMSDNEYVVGNFERTKSKPLIHRPMLRLYALRSTQTPSKNEILVTGGGIKLVDKIQDCAILSNELSKIAEVRTYLIANNIHTFTT